MSDPTIFVRKASHADEEAISEHQRLGALEAVQYRGSAVSQQHDSIDTLTFVAGVGTTIMGSLIATQQSAQHWTIESVFVVSTCREIGIGDSLVVTCLAELSQRDAIWVQSRALPGDRATKNLFERHGLVAQTIIVGKAL